jgi:L-threonylcarbamoyladenylate synthase
VTVPAPFPGVASPLPDFDPVPSLAARTMQRPGPEILQTHTPELFAAAVAVAAERLRAGEVVALPTETVYGLAANATDPEAVARIYAIKGRPSHNPIIVHASDRAMARSCAANWPDIADLLADEFWPGPLTLVVPKSDSIPEIVAAGGTTIGIRWPGHPFMQAVIRACGFPIAAPSANRSNELSPTNADHVVKSLGARLPLIVDGGQCQVGLESTVVDLTISPARVLRPGMITAQALARFGIENLRDTADPRSTLKSPGLLTKHYSPKALLAIHSWRDEKELQALIDRSGMPAERVHVITHHRVPLHLDRARVVLIPDDPEAFARALYAQLHACDDLGAGLILVETPPDSPEWQAIRDRLDRAATQ